jgi:HKD family nuclease
MRIRPFLQREGLTTLDEIERLIDTIQPTEGIFCFAYATVSGCAEFQRRVGDTFWESVSTRWLVGIDYGRSQPAAFDFLSNKNNSSVRVFNGDVVVEREGFFPQRDFHMKACILRNLTEHQTGALIGSANFSRNGLSASIECGVSLIAANEDEHNRIMRPTYRRIRQAWNQGTPLAAILERYRQLWEPTQTDTSGPESEAEEAADPTDFERFWIDVGYVTRNRGPERPGNQIDMPRGTHEFFGFAPPANLPANSTIGEIVFVGQGNPVARNLRLGNNLMEKITLPLPENYPFGAYDGKVLEFRRVVGGFEIDAFEQSDFRRLLQTSSRCAVNHMGSGRPYGYRQP